MHKKQIANIKGVALIQVLLISLMLTVLAIHIAKESREQVKVANLIDQRGHAIIKANSLVERVKFALLTDDKFARESKVLGHHWNFYDHPIVIDKNIELRMQDESGLISVAFPSAELEKYINEPNQYLLLGRWNGWESTNSSDRGSSVGSEFRNGYMPYTKEFKLLTDLEEIPDYGLTHKPSRIFNLYNSPDDLIKRIYSLEDYETITALRQSGNDNYNHWKDLLRGDSSAQFAPGRYLRIKVIVQNDSFEIIRKTALILNLDSANPLLEVAI